jgi:hypothetical protein
MKLEDLRRLYDIRELTNMGRKKYCVCPLPQHLHHNYTPSFSVFWNKGVQYFKCHGNCGKWGDVIDFAGYVNISDYNPSDIGNRIRASEFLTGFKSTPPTPPKPTPTLPQWTWEEMLPPSQETIDYAISRGILKEHIETFRIGTPRKGLSVPEYWMAIPTFHKEELMGIKLRNMKGGLRYMSYPGSRKGLWGYNDIYMTDKPVLVMKGEIAAMVARRFGFLSCAPTGGEGCHVDDLRLALSLSANIVIGDNGAETEAERRAIALNTDMRLPPKEYVGWDDWALENTEEAIQTTQEWIKELA